MNRKDVFVDTNVLVYHTFRDFDAEKHEVSVRVLNNLFTAHRVVLSPQILREFAAIVTKKTVFEQPLSYEQVIIKISEFEKNFTVVYENQDTLAIFKSMIAKYKINGSRVHDVYIAATMIANGINSIFTFNDSDFRGFNEISVMNNR